MANRVEGVTEKLLECAKEEFLAHGLEGASLRVIAENAGSSKGAIYIRFPDKDALFSALVAPIAEEWLSYYDKGNQITEELISKDQPQDMWSMSDEMFDELINHVFENREAFLLLIDKAAGSSYEHFLDKLVEEELRQSMVYLDGMRAKGHTVSNISKQDLHVLLSAQFYALFEIIRHDTNKQDAIARIHTVVSFFRLGWQKIFSA
jgi:AcrR family transcriptional regulator